MQSRSLDAGAGSRAQDDVSATVILMPEPPVPTASKMREEIRQQPEAIARTVEREWERAEELRAWFQKHPPELVILAARGTSDNAAQFGRYLIEITTGIPVSLAAPSVVTLYQTPLRMVNAVVVAVSQSGESTDTNLVLSNARQQGAFTVGITNESGSTLAREAQQCLLVHAERERSVAATKTYTGQLTCFYLLAYALGAAISRNQVDRLPELATAALMLEREMHERAERYRFMRHAVAIGRGLNYSNSFELSLKLMETCYVVAERFSSADLLHGPIAMLEDSFPAFVFCPAGPTWSAMRELLGKLATVKAEVLHITDRSNQEAAVLRSGPVRPITIDANVAADEPKLPVDIWTPVPYIIPGQFFAASLSEVKGLNPDQPRTLSKVTQTM